MSDANFNIISDQNIPQIPPNPFSKNNNIQTDKNIINSIQNQTIAYSYVSIIFIVILVIFIGIMINDINCKILNVYYNTKKYNDHIIIKMFII